MSIVNTIREHRLQLELLDIPSLFDFNEDTLLPNSPYIYQYKLQSIKLDCLNLKKNKLEHDYDTKLNNLLNDIDEKSFIIEKLIGKYHKNLETHQEIPEIVEKIELNDDSDLVNLRKRLLSGGTSTSLDDSSYHDNLQSDLLQDLSSLTTTLKSGALNLSQKILGEDLNILNQTNDNILKNSSLFKSIDKNLSNYLENKTGNKIGMIWLIKVTAALVITFLFMVLLIKIIPRIGSPV